MLITSTPIYQNQTMGLITNCIIAILRLHVMEQTHTHTHIQQIYVYHVLRIAYMICTRRHITVSSRYTQLGHSWYDNTKHDNPLMGTRMRENKCVICVGCDLFVDGITMVDNPCLISYVWWNVCVNKELKNTSVAQGRFVIFPRCQGNNLV